MKKSWAFVVIALIASLALAALISPFASSHPDGLEKVASDKGFLAKAEDEEPAWRFSPMPDYVVTGVGSEALATALAGVAGTLIVFVAGFAIAKVAARRKPAQA